VQIVSPFVDGDGNPWVLGFHQENQECQLFGPFNQDNPPVTTWRVVDDEGDEQPSVCISVEPGSEDGFLVRGYIPPAPFTEDPPQGFLVALDGQFETRWTIFDEPHTDLGVYGGPLANVAYSPERNRVLSWFLGVVNLGAQSVTQLHAMAIADNTGLVRRVVTSFGRASTGSLQGMLVIPDDGRFLIAVHDNGTTLLVYDGLETIDEYGGGGQIDWGEESIAYIQFNEEGDLFIVHFPRLDFSGVLTYLTRVSNDGESQYYDIDLEKTIEITDEASGEPIPITFPRPILNYVTATTATFVRQAGSDFVLHVYDNASGEDVAIQSLSTIDENGPTHLVDARATDRLILMTVRDNGDGTFTRLVDIIAWDPEAETPGIYPQPERDDPVEPGSDAGVADADSAGDAGDPGDGGTDEGCCAVAGSSQGSLGFFVGVALLAIIRRRER